MSSATSISGILTPLMVPLSPNGDINEEELRRYIDWLIDKGVHGLYPNGSTGEFTRFNAEERRRIIKIVCDQTANRVPVLAGAAEANIRETLDACSAYHDFGARAVAIVSPFYYKLSPESVFAYFREIAINSPIDVTLYNIPLFASPIDNETVCRLAEFDRIIGIKDSSGDLASMTRMIRSIRPHRPDFLFMTGWDAVLVPMLMAGCQGGTHATSGIVPEITRAIYDLTKKSDFDKALSLQKQLLELFDTTFCAADFPEGFRSAINQRGFDFGKGRQPLTEQQAQILTVATEKIRLLIQQMITNPILN
ncbi:dihydrodipicolinate synthase family protein [Planctomycetaceae bacterium]|nr:dihydrodipicolinate synthase family protein [Planctomycetaceae bacterium]